MTRSHAITKLLHGQRGNTAILFALCLPVLLGCAALAVDLARLNMVKVELQNAADAAALAGANKLIIVGSNPNWSVATSTATQVAQSNFANGAQILASNVTINEGNSLLKGYWDKSNGFSQTFVNGYVPAIKVKIVSGPLNLFFGYFLGPNGANGPTDKPVSASAIATAPNPGGPFDNGIFSTTSPIFKNVNHIYVTGSVRTNDDLTITALNSDISGAAAAHGAVTLSNKITYGSILPNADIINMPDYSAPIAAAAALAGPPLIGPQEFTGSQIYSNPIYVQDSPGTEPPGSTGTLHVISNTVSFSGAVMADGNITFDNNVGTVGNGQVSFYSKYGNITINNNVDALHGVFYAPNGTITITGNVITVYGSIVAKTVTIIGANNLYVYRTNTPITSLQGRGGVLVQ